MSKAHAAVLQMTGGVNLIYESMEMDAGMNSKKQKAVTVDNQMMRSQCAQNCTMMLSMQQTNNIMSEMSEQWFVCFVASFFQFDKSAMSAKIT